MVVAVPVMRVMQMTLHQITGVVTVGNGFMTAAGSVHVIFGMPCAGVIRRAGCRVLLRDLDDVMFHGSGAAIGMMQVAIVQIVYVIAVLHGRVAAALAVLVVMMLAGLLIRHGLFLLQ